MTVAAADTTATFRRATAADLDLILRLLADLGDAEDHQPRRERVLAAWDSIAALPDYAVWIAEIAGVPLGTYAIMIMPSLGHDCSPAAVVENVVVAAAARGRGLGAAMMRHACLRAAEAGCYKLALSSNKKRIDAHRFYRRIGFADHGISLAITPGDRR